MAGLLRQVKAPQRMVRMLRFSLLDTAGVPSLTAGGTDGTVADLDVGEYEITFTEPFGATPQVFIQTKEADCVAHVVAADTDASKVTINVFELDGITAEDGSLDILVIGSDASDEV